MNLPIEWLQQFVKTSGSTEKIANTFTSIGQEVESITKNTLKLDITPNRGDCLSILGLAREYAAVTNRELLIQKSQREIRDTNNQTLNLSFESKSICTRYTYKIIENIQIQDSPKWLQDRLIQYGFRPINNIVDITNFIMVELGQPMHAFDLNKIHDNKINIRLSKKNEKLITLDGKNHKLDNAIVFEDGRGHLIDLAGIMGGYLSEIDNKTKSIILQAAVFDSILIRKTSKKLKQTTDASYRYERGVDWNNTLIAVKRASELIKESCNKSIFSKTIDIQNEKPKTHLISWQPDKINKLLSTNLSEKELLSILQGLGFKKQNNSIRVPSWRYYDIDNWQDLVEEVGRIYGYTKLKKIRLLKQPNNTHNNNYILLEKIKDELTNIGYDEIIGYPLVAQKSPIKIINPASKEHQFLRTNLLDSVLKVASNNPWYPNIKIFEIGKSYESHNEKYELILLETSNKSKNMELGINNISKKLGLNLKYKTIKPDASTLITYKIKRNITLLSIELENLRKNIPWSEIRIEKHRINYKKISKYSPSIRDLAFIVGENISANNVLKDIKNIHDTNSQVIFVEQFDEFKHPKFGNNKKNLAFHIIVDPINKITEKHINSIFDRIIDTITKKYKAKLREF